MTNKSSLRNLLSRFLLAALLVVTFFPATTEAAQPGTLTRATAIWLKRSGNVGDRLEIIQASKWLRDIPGVVSVSIGAVLPSNRFGTDTSYDLLLVVTFRNGPSLTAFTQHPLYQRFYQVLIPRLSRFVAYESVNW